MKPVKNIGEFKRLKESLRKRFETERTGDQDLFREQTKIFEPLINTQHQTVKAITDEHKSTSNALLPYIRDVSEQNK